MKIRMMAAGMVAVVAVGALLGTLCAAGYTGCAGDQTHSAVVAEWLFSEGNGTDSEDGNLTLIDGAGGETGPTHQNSRDNGPSELVTGPSNCVKKQEHVVLFQERLEVDEEFAHSVAETAHTDALEFDDGTLLLGKPTPLHQVTWDHLIARVGRDRLVKMLGQSNLVGFQNWTQVPLLAHHMLFLGLTDPERRDPNDIRKSLALIRRFEQTFQTYLGLHEKESFEIAHALGYP